MHQIPDPNQVFPNEYKTSCFIKNVVKAPNISIGDYTYYDDATDPTGFEQNNVLFNYPEFGDHLIIGKFCAIASGTKFIMGPANHRLCSVTTYPFHVFGGAWQEGVKIGDGAIVAAYSVVVKDIPAYTVFGGNPAKFVKQRFDKELTDLLLQFRWWDLEPEALVEVLPLLCDPNLEKVKQEIKVRLSEYK